MRPSRPHKAVALILNRVIPSRATLRVNSPISKVILNKSIHNKAISRIISKVIRSSRPTRKNISKDRPIRSSINRDNPWTPISSNSSRAAWVECWAA